MNAPRPPAHPALRFSLAVIGLALGAALTLFAGCGLSTGGIPASDAGAACTSSAQCDDMNPCTTDACSADGTCTHVDASDGPAPASAQVTGDCHTILCAGGVATNTVDDTDVGNSGNPCILDECSMGMPLQDQTKNNLQPCMTGGLNGSCNNGACGVVCTMNGQCVPNPPNPCVTPMCDGGTGLCTYPPLADGTPTPGVTQVMGDCQAHICLGGMDKQTEDDSDVPAKMGDCQDPTCQAGVPTQAPHPSDAPCSTFMTSQPGFCNGKGACVQCTKDNECSGTLNDCEHPACTGNACMTAFTPSGTPTTTTPPQAMGTCKQTVCDGAGNVISINDDNNPPNSGTVCATDTCSGGAVVATDHPGIMCGTSMGTPEVCNGMGQCGCQNNGDCTLPSTCGGGGVSMVCGCTPPPPATTCAALDKTCGPSFPDGCYGTIACNDGKKDGTETDIDCGGVATPGSTCANLCVQGKHCGATSDCTSGLTCVDGVCCNSTCTGTCQACSALKKGQGADGVCGAIKSGQDPDTECPMAAPATCGDVGGCNGAGACTLYSNITVCKAASCKDAITLTNAEDCDGMGHCVAPTMLTTDCTPYACSGTACKSTCTGDGDCAGTAYCNLMGAAPHHCVPKLSTGTSGCTAGDQCSSTVCGNNGVCCAATCAHMGGPCGNTGCATGSGMCTYPVSGTSCGAVCGGGEITPSTCDGMGVCNAGTQGPCPGNFQCLSGSACFTGCGAAGPGDDAKCIAGYYCDGVGAGNCVALVTPGGMCGGNDQCTTSICGAAGSGNCCAGACTTTGLCPSMGCSSSGGMCQYPTGATCGTSCNNSNSMLTTTTCDTSGGCTMVGAPAACPGNASCMNGTACNPPNCGNNGPAGDANCAMGYWCDGAVCQTPQGNGSTCTRGSQCTSNNCAGGMCHP